MYSKIPLIGRRRRVAAVTSLSHPVTPSERHRPRRAARAELAKIDKKQGARAARRRRPLKSYTGNRISAVGRRRRPAHCHRPAARALDDLRAAPERGHGAPRRPRSIRPQAPRPAGSCGRRLADTLFRTKNGARSAPDHCWRRNGFRGVCCERRGRRAPCLSPARRHARRRCRRRRPVPRSSRSLLTFAGATASGRRQPSGPNRNAPQSRKWRPDSPPSAAECLNSAPTRLLNKRESLTQVSLAPGARYAMIFTRHFYAKRATSLRNLNVNEAVVG